MAERVEGDVPSAPGVHVTVFVIESPNGAFHDLLLASQSSLESGTILSMTKTGTMPKQGDIPLIPIPFSDLSSQKRRPVIVILNDQYNGKTGDVVVVAMTSNPQVTDYSFSIPSSDLVRGALNRPGKVRVDKIYPLSQAII